MEARLISIKAGIRRLLVPPLDTLDRWLHASRAARARRRLGAWAPSSVLFVCLGNICRSPYAERALRQQTAGRIEVTSAGLIGPGRSPPAAALRTAGARGTDHSDHVSELVTSEMLAAAHAVFVFDRRNALRLRRVPGARLDRVLLLGDLDPVWAGKRAIVDPWREDDAAYRATFDRIDRCVAALVQVLRACNAP